MAKSPLTFSARLEQRGDGGPYYILIPRDVSEAIGRRGIVPVRATVNRVAEVQASMTPCGDGRHQLRLNAETRALAGARLGQRLTVALSVDDAPAVSPMPSDLSRALRDQGLLPFFAKFPVGKRNHIVQWIEQAAKTPTRDRRIALTLEVTERAREKALDRIVDQAAPSSRRPRASR